MTESRIHLRGFASMTPERRREISAMGGAAVPVSKRSFSQSKELAQTAGRKGGQISRKSVDRADG